jgi:hypothetical protein
MAPPAPENPKKEKRVGEVFKHDFLRVGGYRR